MDLALKSMEMEGVLAESFPGKTLQDFLAQERREKVDNAKKSLVDMIMVVIDKAKAAKKCEAAGGNKFLFTAELKATESLCIFDEISQINTVFFHVF